ncbi:phospholipid scramblase 2 isoform X3 [Temnothorax longispinosus]|uniref:phospholipid scramblase 2 isoform X3 n=1 Tax=Temnothorax longispinosus TaxID=300112 RepID=UPI003A99EDC8
MSSQKYDAPYPPLSGVEEMQPPIATAPPPQPNVPMPVLSPDDSSPPSITCPPGLEYLLSLDCLLVNQKNMEVDGWQTRRNKYGITDNNGERVFYIEQELRTYWGTCLRKYNSFHEYITYDRNQQETLRLVQPFMTCCSLPVLQVYSGSTLLGSVTQEWGFWQRKFYIRDASDQEVLMIKGSQFDLKIKSLDEKYDIGMIQKHWRGFSQEMFNQFHVSDKYGINFPRDLDVKIKAVLLGATILIDFLFFARRRSR